MYISLVKKAADSHSFSKEYNENRENYINNTKKDLK
jgi:hypothetical protein